MGSFRPPQHGYGPPPGQGAWNTHQYALNQQPQSFPPPPASVPPQSQPSPYGYQIQTVGGQTVGPVVPPRFPEPYGQSSTPAPGPQAYQQPQPSNIYQPAHQHTSSNSNAYSQEVPQNIQAYSPHSSYSNQPTTHNYDPPRLPLRPGTAARPEASGHQYGGYNQPPAQEQAPDPQYDGAAPYQHQSQSHSYAPSPVIGHDYGTGDHRGYQQQAEAAQYQAPGGYVPPPPPPKPQQYGYGEQQPPRPTSVANPYAQQYNAMYAPGQGYPTTDQQPPRPVSVAHSYEQQYQAQQPPSQGGAYPGTPQHPSSQYEHGQGGQHEQYTNVQPPPDSRRYSQAPQYPLPDHALKHAAHGRHTAAQSSSRPPSKAQSAHGYGRPASSSGEHAPVSPLQTRQSISLERPASTLDTSIGAVDTSRSHTPKTAFATTFSSDWEHFGAGADEIDDTAMYGVKRDGSDENRMASVELPASSPLRGHSTPDVQTGAPESFRPSPASGSVMQHEVQPSEYVPTPPPGYPTSQPKRPAIEDAGPYDEADYIPPMPNTPPAVTRPARTPVVLGGSSQSATSPSSARSSAMNEGGAHGQNLEYATQQAPPSSRKLASPQAQAQVLTTYTNPPLTLTDVRPTATNAESAQLKRAQQEAEDYKAELGQLQQELMNIRALLSRRDALLAERDHAITGKDEMISQKDVEIAHRTARLDEVQASLSEITETFTALRTSTSGLEERAKIAEGGVFELQRKLAQNEAELKDVKMKFEQSGKDREQMITKLREVEAAKTDIDTKHEQTVLASATLATKNESEKKELDQKLQEAQIKLTSSLAEVSAMKKELEEEKAKAVAKAKEPLDIAPGLEPWFKGSLERCKEMLYAESKPISVQDKLKLFMDFVTAEAQLRGVNMPLGPSAEVKGSITTSTTAPARTTEPMKPERPRIAPPAESDGFVLVDSDSDVQYSPGGRPLLHRKVSEEYSPGGRPVMKKTRTLPMQIAGQPKADKLPPMPAIQPSAQNPSYQSLGAVASSPASALKGPTHAQLPSAQVPKPAYQSFAAGMGAQKSKSEAGPPQIPPEPVYKPLFKPTGNARAVDTRKSSVDNEIFFDPVPGARPTNRRETLKGSSAEHMLPEPLKPRTPAPPSTTARTARTELPGTRPGTTGALVELPAARSPTTQRPQMSQNTNSLEQLASLVSDGSTLQNSERIRDLTAALDNIDLDYSFTKMVSKTWEDKAAVTRAQHAKERAKRQAEVERRNNELFDDGEIGYGDLDALEAQAKENELRSKADEDVAEHESFTKDVFDVIYKRCHGDIGVLVRLQNDVEKLLQRAAGGRNVVSAQHGESLSQGIHLLLQVHDKLELAHAEGIKAVQEQDRRYKLTQTKPLYAAGDIAAMKRVEKACEESERKSEVRARVEKAERCKRIHHIVDAEMKRSTGENEDFAEDVIGAAETAVTNARDGEDALVPLLDNAIKIVARMYEDTQDMMKCFAHVDTELNECEYDVSVASARLKGDPKEYFERLETEKKREDAKLMQDAEKRWLAVREHQKEAEAHLRGLMARLQEGDAGKEERVRKEKALEEARRRNGA